MNYNSREIIMNIMRDLVSRGKFEKATVDKIVKMGGLTRGSFYYHFQNKYDLIEQIFLKDIGELHIDNDELFFEGMKRILTVLSNKRNYYHHSISIFDFRAFLYRYFEDYVGRWYSNKAPSQPFLPRLLAYGWVAYICQWAREGFKESPDELIELFKTIKP